VTLRPHPRVRLLASEILCQAPAFRVVDQKLELPSGLRQHWALVEHGGATAIAAVGEDGRLLVVRQFRPAAGDWIVELPAGRLDPGEAPLAAAQREFEEETGHRASQWKQLATFLPAPGFCSEVMHLFEARELEAVPGGGLAYDQDEEIEVLWMHPRTLLEQDPLDGKTLVAVQALLLRDQ